MGERHLLAAARGWNKSKDKIGSSSECNKSNPRTFAISSKRCHNNLLIWWFSAELVSIAWPSFASNHDHGHGALGGTSILKRLRILWDSLQFTTGVENAPHLIFFPIVRATTSKAQFHTPLLSRTGAGLPSHSILFYEMKKRENIFGGNSPCQHSYKIEPSCVYNWELLGEGSIIKLPSVYWSPNISVDFCRTAMRYKYKYIYELSANICRQGCMEAPEKCRSKILKLAITRWPTEACQSTSCSDR